jgi:myo-inositol-1(or 4)-monophosphatase
MYEELRKARPDWGLLLEEGGEIEGDPTKPRWIVDPLDGTSNFLHGIPHFAISIAVEEPMAAQGKQRDHPARWSISR